MSSIPNRIDFLEYGLRELIRKSNPSLLLEKEEGVTLSSPVSFLIKICESGYSQHLDHKT